MSSVEFHIAITKNLQYKTHPDFWPSPRRIFKTSLYYKTRLILETRRYIPWNVNRVDSRFLPSQWETALLCSDVSLAGCKPSIVPVSLQTLKKIRLINTFSSDRHSYQQVQIRTDVDEQTDGQQQVTGHKPRQTEPASCHGRRQLQ